MLQFCLDSFRLMVYKQVDLPDTALTEFQNKVGVTSNMVIEPEVWFHVLVLLELELGSIY